MKSVALTQCWVLLFFQVLAPLRYRVMRHAKKSGVVHETTIS